MRLVYYVNGAVLGSVIPKADSYEFDIHVTNELADSELERVDIFGEQGNVLLSEKLEGHEQHIKLSLTEQQKYYFVRIVQKDAKHAVTAPVWIGDC